MTKVYVTQETGHDFSGAEQWGEIEFITRLDLNNIKGSLHNVAVQSEVAGKIRQFDELTDWIIIAGSPYISAMVFMMLGRRGIKYVNVLRWDNRDLIYRPMFLDIGDRNGK